MPKIHHVWDTCKLYQFFSVADLASEESTLETSSCKDGVIQDSGHWLVFEETG